MKKITVCEQKKIIGGGPCGKQFCSDVVIPGAIYTGSCNSFPTWCLYIYITTTTCNGNTLSHTYCTQD